MSEIYKNKLRKLKDQVKVQFEQEEKHALDRLNSQWGKVVSQKEAELVDEQSKVTQLQEKAQELNYQLESVMTEYDHSKKDLEGKIERKDKRIADLEDELAVIEERYEGKIGEVRDEKDSVQKAL